MGKKVHHEEHENHERWLVSYADFITLLFAFFTVLYALGQGEKSKVENAMQAIKAAFMSGGGVFPLRGQPFSPFNAPPNAGQLVPPSPSEAGQHKPGTGDGGKIERMQKQLQQLFEKNTGFSVSPNDLEVVQDRHGFRIRLGEKLLFGEGTDKLKKRNAAFLYEVGKRLAALDLEIQVEGHSDNAQPTGSKSNWGLSIDRASNVVKFMVEGAGYPKEKISVAGYGDTRPIAPNDSPAGQRRNRRVEISVITDQKIDRLPW